MAYLTLDKLNGITAKLRRFIYSGYYPFIVAAVALCCFVLRQQTLGLFLFITGAGIILISLDDLSPVIPLFACVVLFISDFKILTTAPFIIIYCLLALCFIYHFLSYPVKNFYLGRLFFPLCFVSIALLLGGLLSVRGRNNYSNGFLSAFATGPLLLVIYLLFLNGVKPPDNFDIRTYLSRTIIAATVAACTEVVLCYASSDFAANVAVGRDFTWGNFNTVGAMTLIAVPACFYLMIRTGKFATLFFTVIFMIATDVLCHSDGSAGIILFSFPFLVFFTFTYVNKRDRKPFTLCIFALALLLFAAGIYALLKFGLDGILSYVRFSTDDHGRLMLYEQAAELFKENPVLGIGQGYFDEAAYYRFYTDNFHSTVFHVAATMGCVGLIAYAVYYFFRIKIILGGKHAFNAFAFLSFVLFEAYGLIDVCEFNIIPLMSYMTLVILCAEKTDEKAEDDRLPLSYLY